MGRLQLNKIAAFRGWRIGVIRQLSPCLACRQLYTAAEIPRRSLRNPPLQWRGFITTATRTPLTKDKNGDVLIRSPYEDINVPNVTFPEYVFSKLDEYKHLICMVDNETGETYTGAQLKEYAIRIASGLARLGYRKGDVIMLFITNCPQYSMLFLACGILGVTVTTANPVYTSGELARQLDYSESCAVVTMPTMVSTVKAAIKSSMDISDNVKELIVIGEADGCRPFSSLLEDDGMALPDNIDLDPRNDVTAMPFSSGTTGLPKGVLLTHTNLVANLAQMNGGPLNFEPGRDCLLGLLPFYHIYGMVIVQFGAILQGTKLVVMPKFEPEKFLSAIQNHKINHMHLVPPVVLFLAKHALVDNYKMGSLRSIYCGAAPLGEAVTSQVCDRLDVNLLQLYGLTECSPLTHGDAPPPKSGTIGRLIPNTTAKMVDPMTGAPVGVGQQGELLIKGPQVMKGYLKNPTATEETIRDGWLYSGDIGHVDAEGYFTISDRRKELIKYKGYQVAPAELESVLCSHPSVQDAAVIGLPMGEDVGEVPKAFVVTKPNMEIGEAELKHYVAENVAPYKKLRGGVTFISEIPKTASGKILRQELKKI